MAINIEVVSGSEDVDVTDDDSPTLEVVESPVSTSVQTGSFIVDVEYMASSASIEE